MSFPPLPPSFDDDPHGKPTVSEWLLERVRADQAAVRAVAETNRRIGRILDRCYKAVNEPEATRRGGIRASSDGFEAPSDSDVAARQGMNLELISGALAAAPSPYRPSSPPPPGGA